MDAEHQLIDLKHRLALLETTLQNMQRNVASFETATQALQRSLAEETRARERSAEAESSIRDDLEKRLAHSMREVTTRMDTIIVALMGDIKTPDVPGLMHRMTEIRQQQTLTVSALEDLRRYRTSMPTPAELKKLSEASELQQSKLTYVMGWLGGVCAVILILWNVAERLISWTSK